MEAVLPLTKSRPEEPEVMEWPLIPILLADDQTPLRQGLAIILSAGEDLAVVGEVADGGEAAPPARQFEVGGRRLPGRADRPRNGRICLT